MPLYEKLIGPVYERRQSQGGRGGAMSMWYMWWELMPVRPDWDHRDRDRINDAVLFVFEEVLKLTSEVCLSSVLIGIGRFWHHHLPERTEAIVRRFIMRTDITDDIRQSACLQVLRRV